MISLIIPVYKVEAFLRECLDSVLAQTYKDFEAICVNDGSPDSCPKILEEYQKKDNRIKVISQENQGSAVARNTGLDNARGEYIAFLDSDDKVAPTFLEELVSHVDGVDCVEVGVKYFRDDNDLLYMDTPSAWFDQYLFNKAGLFEVKPSLFKYCYVDCWNKLYRREIIEKYNLRFFPGIIHENNYFVFAYLFHCRYVYEVGKKLHFYRNRGNSQSKNISYEHYFDTEKLYIILLEHLVKYGLARKFRRACLFLFIFHTFLENRMMCDRAVETELVTKFAKLLSFDVKKLLAAVEPKTLCVKVQDVSNESNKFRIVECSKNVKRVYGGNSLLIRSAPHDFSFAFDSEKDAMIKILFGVMNFMISCKGMSTDVRILVKEIRINNQKIGENITLQHGKIRAIDVRAKCGARTIVEIKI